MYERHFVSAYLEIECQLIAKIMNYSLNLDFLFPFFAEYFIKPNIFFNTYSLFYGGYRFLLKQANWDHQDEVLVSCSTGWLSNEHSSISIFHKVGSRPLFYGVVVDFTSITIHRWEIQVFVPCSPGWLSNIGNLRWKDIIITVLVPCSLG